VQNRHRYEAITPQSLGLEVGSLWPTVVGFNEFDLSVVELYWEQHIVKDRLAFRVGKMIPFAIHDYFKMKSPASGFTNAIFTLNPSIAWVGFGLGATALVRPHDNFYILAGVYDANGKPDTAGFNTLFDEGELLTIVDVGWDPGYINKQTEVRIGPFTVSDYHLTFWHRDALKNVDAPSGWGLTLFLENRIGNNLLTFFRYGYSQGSSAGSPAILNHMVAGGIGIEQPFDRRNDVIGLGVSWGNRDLGTVAIDITADGTPDPIRLGDVDQWAGELFYRLQLTEEIQVTPSVQLIVNPAFNPDNDVVGVFGIRARAEF
jgi:porin